MSKALAGISGMQAGNYNARAAERDAVAAQQDGAAAEARVREEARYAAGEAIAAQGQSGMQLGTGSALDLLRENAVNAELDQLTIRTRAENMRRGKIGEAGLARATGRAALVQGIIGTAEDAARAFGGGG
ncbi:MAG: hypothetical protein ACOYLS_01290 [Polymorphobacter sp.]